jgi:hypothetical protein
MAQSNGTLYVGGSFTTMGGQARSRLAAFDAATGVLGAWNPGPSGTVLALHAAGGRVYAGGAFGLVGGQVRRNLAAFDEAGGLLTPWNPSANGAAFTLATHHTTVLAGGGFTAVDELPARGLAAIEDPALWPALAVADVTTTDAGTGTRPVPIVITLSQPSSQTVNVAVCTRDSTALAGPDYLAMSRVVFFPPGAVAETVFVQVVCDSDAVQREEFSVVLSGAERALIGDLQGVVTIVSSTVSVGGAAALEFGLSRIAPNPAPGAAHMEFTVAREGPVRLEVFDVAGRRVAVLADGVFAAGRHHVKWTAGREGARAAAGVYFARFEGGSRRFVRRFVLLD